MAMPIFTKYTQYKGHAVLILTTGKDDQFPFRFGVANAKRILECVSDIKRFVEDDDAMQLMKKNGRPQL